MLCGIVLSCICAGNAVTTGGACPALPCHVLQESKEPEIYRAIRFGCVLENVVFDRL
jgi:ATP-dependent phosphoenolpyruvate carboxykinase